MRVVDRVNALVQGYAAGKRVELGFALSQGIADNHRKSVGNVAFAQVGFYFSKFHPLTVGLTISNLIVPDKSVIRLSTETAEVLKTTFALSVPPVSP